MTICCHKVSRPPSSDSDGDNHKNVEIPKLNEVLNSISVYRYYISGEKL